MMYPKKFINQLHPWMDMLTEINHTLKPGAILSLKDVQTYEKILPDGTYVF